MTLSKHKVFQSSERCTNVTGLIYVESQLRFKHSMTTVLCFTPWASSKAGIWAAVVVHGGWGHAGRWRIPLPSNRARPTSPRDPPAVKHQGTTASLLVTKGIATRNKDATGAPGLDRNKNATRLFMAGLAVSNCAPSHAWNNLYKDLGVLLRKVFDS